MSKLTSNNTKLHYKMFKAGKFWVFMSLSSALLIGGVAITAHAATDETSTDASTETSTDSSSTPDNQATLRTATTTEAEVPPTDASSSDTPVQSETPAATPATPAPTSDAEVPADTQTTTGITKSTESPQATTPATDAITKDETPQSDTDKIDSINVTPTPTAIKKVVRVDAVSQQATDAVTNLHLDVLVGQSNTVEPGEVDVEGNRYYRMGIDGAFNISADDLVAGKSYDIATLTVLPDPSNPDFITQIEKSGADVGASVFDGNKNGNEIGSIVLSDNKLVFTVSDKYDPTQHALIGNGYLALTGLGLWTLTQTQIPLLSNKCHFPTP